MTNRGKFTDRIPCLPAAGLVSPWSRADVQRCFKHDVTPEEELSGESGAGPRDHLVPPGYADIYRGFNTDARRCLQPELDKGFRLDRTGLHPGTGLTDRTYGRATDRSCGAGELINPPKTYAEVMAEAARGHEMYRRTHLDYEPGERVSRSYGRPYREGLVWGKSTPCDPYGGCAKKVVSWETDKQLLVSKILADLKIRTKPLIGKALAPNDNATLVPRDHAYGSENQRSAVGVGELLRECAHSLDRSDALEELSYIKQLRGHLCKRRPPVEHRDLEDAFHERDPTGSGRLPTNEVQRILADRHIHPHQSLFDRFLTRMDILSKDGQVTYNKVLDVLNVNVEFPDLPHIKDVPDKFLHFETTNQLAYKYHCDQDAAEAAAVTAAGSPPRAHEDVGVLLGPSAFTACGIHPRQFFEPRSLQFVSVLVNRLGHQLDDTTLKNMWNLAQDDEGCVTVQRFLDILNSQN